MKFLKYIGFALVCLLAIKPHSAQELEFLEKPAEEETANNLRENQACAYFPCTSDINCCTGYFCGLGAFCIAKAKK